MKKKSISKTLLVFVLLSLIPITFLACSNSVEGYTLVEGEYKNDNPSAVVIIVGNHANAMEIPADAYNAVEETLDKVVYGGYICAIIADATPTKINLIDDKDFFREDARNSTTLSNRIEERTGIIIDKLNNLNIPADSPEVDLLAAIREAKNALDNNQVGKIVNKQIFIIDTGISTAGDLNFVDMDFLNRKPNVQDIIKQLETYEGVGVLPDLTGITVTFVGTADGLAEVAEPQIVSTTDKKFIKELWTEVIKACGTSDIQFESAAGWDTPNIYTEDIDSKFPYVSPITFYHERVIDYSNWVNVPSNNPDSQPSLPDPPIVEIELPSRTVGFKPDEADYFNTNSAKSTLKPFADELKEFFRYYPDEKIWIIGTTAAVQQGATGSIELSLRRAETVKNTLVTEFDIPEENLITIGLGAKFPWFVDEYPSGVFDTNVAQENRAVWLLTANVDNDKFSQLKEAYDSGELLPKAMTQFSLYYQ